MKFKGEIEITPKEIADLVRELQSQPEIDSSLDDLLGISEEQETPKRVRGAKI